jgi:hypothetical protein
MTTKKKSNVSTFLPINTAANSTGGYQTPLPNIQPDFPESGVRFAGYYRKKLPSGEYAIHEQKKFVDQGVYVSGTLAGNKIWSFPSGSIYFITKIYIQYADSNSNLISFYNGTPTNFRGQIQCWKNMTLGSDQPHDCYITLDYSDCPIPIDSGSLIINLSNNVGVGQINIFILGFQEFN